MNRKIKTLIIWLLAGFLYGMFVECCSDRWFISSIFLAIMIFGIFFWGIEIGKEQKKPEEK